MMKVLESNPASYAVFSWICRTARAGKLEFFRCSSATSFIDRLSVEQSDSEVLIKRRFAAGARPEATTSRSFVEPGHSPGRESHLGQAKCRVCDEGTHVGSAWSESSKGHSQWIRASRKSTGCTRRARQTGSATNAQLSVSLERVELPNTLRSLMAPR